VQKRPTSAKNSKKHPVLEHIFFKYFDRANPQEVIPFFLSDISEGYRACGIPEPVSISNTILDLTRQDRGISSRVPETISALGYDLRKRTGPDAERRNYAGEFVRVGVGKTLSSWLNWPSELEEIPLQTNRIPPLVLQLIKKDESGLFSVIDYTNFFSVVLYHGRKDVFRVQNPMKWQPNEIDGLYAMQDGSLIILYPVEAKALTTKDEINLDQLLGAYNTVRQKLEKQGLKASIQSLAVKMVKNGIRVAIYPPDTPPTEPNRYCQVTFDPPIANWR
jgi:hypothetical protein